MARWSPRDRHNIVMRPNACENMEYSAIKEFLLLLFTQVYLTPDNNLSSSIVRIQHPMALVDIFVVENMCRLSIPCPIFNLANDVLEGYSG